MIRHLKIKTLIKEIKRNHINILLIVISIQGCASMVFNPKKNDYKEDNKANFKEWIINSQSGNKIRIRKYLSKNEESQNILYFYGNSKNLTYRIYDYLWVTDHGFNVYIFDYSGYGMSSGKPKFEKINKDALSVINFIKHSLLFKKTNLF